MRIELVRHGGAKHTLRCTRTDGSVTWETRHKHGEFFALHDLTHFSIESVCAYRNGFFGLISQGWNIEDTTGKGARGALPREAGEVEQLAGLFELERAGATIWTPDDFAAAGSLRRWTADELAQVRRKRSELFARWAGMGERGSLTLDFPRP